MPEPTAIAGVVIAIASALGGVGACAHFKMKSNCCSWCESSCWDRETVRKNSTSNIIEQAPKITEL
jgi:hypothetical protein